MRSMAAVVYRARMKKISGVGVCAVLMLAGCVTESEEVAVAPVLNSPRPSSGLFTQVPSAEHPSKPNLVDKRGHLWTWRKTITTWAAVPDEAPKIDPTKLSNFDINSMSDYELAGLLQPVMLMGGDEYFRADRDVAEAAAIRVRHNSGGRIARPLNTAINERDPFSLRATKTPGFASDRSPAPGPQDLLQINGSDDRTFVTHPNISGAAYAPNVFFTTTTALTASGATGTMVGPSTAITAAHLFYRPATGWTNYNTWAVGVVTSHTNTFTPVPTQTVKYGPYQSCGTIVIPGGWTTTPENYEFDYSVIEFNDGIGCFRSPGLTTGWRQYASASDAQILGSGTYNDGYDSVTLPSQSPYASRHYEVPTLLTRWGAGGAVYAQSSNHWNLWHTLDIVGGNSGAGLKQYPFTATGDYSEYVTAISYGEGVWPTTTNYARRLDASVISFFVNNSNL